MDGAGFLFMTGGDHVQVADDDTVKLGNRKWQARHTGEGLELAIEHVENNGRQQVRGCRHQERTGASQAGGAGASSAEGGALDQDGAGHARACILLTFQ